MKIWEDEEFLNIRNFIILFILLSRAYSFAFREFFSWKKLRELCKCTFIFVKENKYFSTYKSQCFKEVYDFMMGYTHCSVGPHAAHGPRVEQPWSRSFYPKLPSILFRELLSFLSFSQEHLKRFSLIYIYFYTLF